MKKLVFYLIALLILYAIVEGASVGMFGSMAGTEFSISALNEERRAIIDAERGAAREDIEERAGAASEGYLRAETLHPYLGYVEKPKPDQPKDAPYYGFLRAISPQPIQQRSEDKLIVGILGGSFARDFSVTGTDRLAELLKSVPAWSNKQIVFVRIALGGHKQPQQLMTLNYIMSLGGEFDIIINLDGFNEVVLAPENLALGSAFMYPRAWRVRTNAVPDIDELELVGRAIYLHDARRTWGGVFDRFLVRLSPFANLVWKMRDNVLSKEAAEVNTALADYTADESDYSQTGPYESFENTVEMRRALVAYWQHCSVLMGRIAEANGAAYYHFLQPNQYVPESKAFTVDEREAAYSDEHSYRPRVEGTYPMLVDAGIDIRNAGVSFTDLSMIYKSVAEPIYIDTCCHVNERGHELVAEAIAKVVLADAPAPAEEPGDAPGEDGAGTEEAAPETQ